MLGEHDLLGAPHEMRGPGVGKFRSSGTRVVVDFEHVAEASVFVVGPELFRSPGAVSALVVKHQGTEYGEQFAACERGIASPSRYRVELRRSGAGSSSAKPGFNECSCSDGKGFRDERDRKDGLRRRPIHQDWAEAWRAPVMASSLPPSR